MRIEANRKHLIERLTRASVALPRRSPKEILTRLLLVSPPSGPSAVYATDMEVSTAVKIDCTVDGGDGKVLLPVRALAMLKECTDETVRIEAGRNGITVACGKASISLQVENPDEFPRPVFPDPEGNQVVIVDPAQLLTAISRTSYATANDSSRFALGGVLFESDGYLLRLVGTDGRRLSSDVIAADSGGSLQGSGQCIVPMRALNAIEKVGLGEEAVRLWSDGSSLHLSSGEVRVASRMVEGRYPSWRQVIPSQDAEHLALEVNTHTMERSLRQASIVADSETRAVDMRVFDDSITLAARAADIGKSKVSIPVDYRDKEVKIRVDYKYLLDFLCAAPETFTLRLEGSSSPVVLQSDGFINVVMPMAMES